jgi:hypothetical protein
MLQRFSGNLEWNCERNANALLLCRNEKGDGWGKLKAQLRIEG